MKIRPGDPNLDNLVKRMKVWSDYCNYFNETEFKPAIEFADNGYPVYYVTDIDGINNETSSVIVINNSTEGINFRKYFEQYNSDKFYIIFSLGIWNPDYYELPIKYINLSYSLYFYEFTDYLFSPYRFQFYYDYEYDFNYPKGCDFVSTTGTVRKERDFIVDRIRKNIQTNNFIFRYSYEDIGIPAGQFDLLDGKPGEFDPFTPKPGMEEYHHHVSHSIPIELYNQGYFNLLLEGDIDYQEQFCPTEKIVKTLISGMPFVLLGSPYFLEHIRDMGFRTYHELWDESYDCIVDFEKRVDSVIMLCNNLINFNWQENKAKLIEIAQHNRNQFMNLGKLSNKDFARISQQINDLNL
jgi:hypothetical protein